VFDSSALGRQAYIVREVCRRRLKAETNKKIQQPKEIDKFTSVWSIAWKCGLFLLSTELSGSAAGRQKVDTKYYFCVIGGQLVII
jgi:hypothetical protein